ncbi:hypothetical protein CC79DRAFT_1329305 [Sarocladium strictum]
MDQKTSSSGQSLDELLACYLHPAEYRATAIVPSFHHRLNILDAWAIPTSDARLLDIGCGQGESCLVLANTSKNFQVTGIDRGPPDYGSPYTLAQSQEFILASPLGQRITFKRTDPVTFLKAEDGQAPGSFDAACFMHSLWYFSSADEVRDVFSALAESQVKRVYIAEWAGTASRPEQEAHLLAFQAQKKLYNMRPVEGESRLHDQNVRGALLPEELFDVAAQAGGYKVARRGSLAAPDDVLDGVWEAGYVTSDDYTQCTLELKDLESTKKEELLAYQGKVKEAVEKAGGKKGVRCMDVTWAVLELSTA